MQHAAQGPEAAPASLLATLPLDVLQRVLLFLGPDDAARCCATCRALRAGCASGHVWATYCRERWHNLPETPSHDADGLCWKHLYEGGNGWSPPAFSAVPFPANDVGFLSAFAFSRSQTGGGGRGASLSSHDVSDSMLLATDEQLQLWSVHCAGAAAAAATLRASCALQPNDLIHSVLQLRDQTVVTGDHRGHLSLYTREGALLARRGRIPLGGLPIVDIQEDPLGGGSTVLAITDCTFTSAVVSSTNQLHFVDVGAEAVVASVGEGMEGYQLLCFGVAPAGSGGGGSEVIAASVQGDFCAKCFEAGLPSLCFHKAQVHSAAVCVFDARAPERMVQRYILPHRSLYPHLHVTRGQYICLSHAGCPLSVWDRRFMSAPLFEETRLANCLDAQGLTKAAGGRLPPFPPPSRPSIHQGLWLDSDGDALIGRAENGMMWVWDLSKTIGWAAARPLQQGSWMGLILAMQRGEPFTQDWPLPLGALPCETSLPITLLPSSAACTLICQASNEVSGCDSLVVARLKR